MLHGDSYVPLSDLERQLFARLVPPDHFLRRLPGVIDFERFRPALAEHYCPGEGRPALDPVFMLKLDLLSIQFRLSDRELMRVAQVNVAYRLFPDIGCDTTLPHHTTMTHFRDRVGAQTLRKIFHGVLWQARERRIVGDRLRLTASTHIIPHIASPSTL